MGLRRPAPAAGFFWYSSGMTNRMNRARCITVMLVAACLSACVKPPATGAVPPTASQRFAQVDRATFDTLIVFQAALEQASADVAKAPQYKPQLNKAIDSYNVAEKAYQVFHATGAGAQTDTLTAALASLTSAMGDIVGLVRPGTGPKR